MRTCERCLPKYFMVGILLLLYGPTTGTARTQLSDQGWSDPTVGTWDPTTKTGTLTQDVYGVVVLMNDGLTLDGNGYQIIGTQQENWHGITAYGKDGITIRNVSVSQFGGGIYLGECANSLVADNTASDNGYGILLEEGSHSVTLRKNKCYSSADYGIVILSSSGNNIIDNTLIGADDSSSGRGLFVAHSSDNEITNNSVSHCGHGIEIGGCSDITLTDNMASDNINGIYVSGSTGNSLSGNSASGNQGGILFSHCNNNMLVNNRTSGNGNGLRLSSSINNTLAENDFSDNLWYGVFFDSCLGESIMTGNYVSGNGFCGVALWQSVWVTLNENMISNNAKGIQITGGSENEVYNNNFISNATHASVGGGSSNVFNLDRPVGGNFWDNWTAPDSDYDGYVDSPFVFQGGQDNLPWTQADGWLLPEVLIAQLITYVKTINLQHGISTSLDSKLKAAARALEDVKDNNDGAAINKMEAFINEVEAQRGNKISEADADALIAMARTIIMRLQS